jgi:hypothetical protein
VTVATATEFTLTLWTDDARLAARADAAGVDRIGIDLETLGKRERQAGLSTWISRHALRDLDPLRGAVRDAALFARVNPLHANSAEELDAVLAAGVEVVMLPMFSSVGEVERFCGLVDGRARIVLLLETIGGLRELPSILALGGVEEVHVGINDMALAMGLRNRFSVMTCGEVADAARLAGAADAMFGIGGIGRVSDDDLPVPSDLVYAQYARLGARGALLSRSFFGPDPDAVDIAAELSASRARLAYWCERSPGELEEARQGLARSALPAERW